MIEPEIEPEVFISSALSDREFVAKLARDIEKSGYTTWYAARDLPAGASVYEPILAALGRCRVMIAVISKDYVESPFASVEVSAAVVQREARQLAIMPVLKDRGVRPPPFLDQYLYLDFSNAGNYQKSLQTLVDSLHDVMSRGLSPADNTSIDYAKSALQRVLENEEEHSFLLDTRTQKSIAAVMQILLISALTLFLGAAGIFILSKEETPITLAAMLMTGVAFGMSVSSFVLIILKKELSRSSLRRRRSKPL